jgi:hypothetical protein
MEPGENLPDDGRALDALVAARLKQPDKFENYSLAFSAFDRKKNEVIRFADSSVDDGGDDRHEQLIETIDLLLSAKPCGVTSYAARKCLWVFVVFSVSEGVLTDRKRKFLRHFSRVAELDTSLLPEMEEAAKSIVGIGKKRIEAKASDGSYAAVLATLAGLDGEEQALQRHISGLFGMGEGEYSSEENDEDIGDYEEESFFDKAGNAVVDVIEGVTDGVVSVIDGFTGAFIDLL